MTVRHKNKTFATCLATLFGSIGLHRFYLHGMKDRAGWIHFLSAPLSLLLLLALPDQPLLFSAMPLMISAMVGVIEALVIGLTADEKWDAAHNQGGGRSASGWPLAVLLVLTFGIGAIGIIAAIARTFDLLFTGGAFG